MGYLSELPIEYNVVLISINNSVYFSTGEALIEEERIIK